MLIYKKGDILKATENIICHQVNVNGVMGGGLALQIASTYPKVEKVYQDYAFQLGSDYSILRGKSCRVFINNHQRIENCFTQKPNFDTDYEAIKICFTNLLCGAKIMKRTIAVPYGYGSNIANGSWTKISRIFDELSDKYDVPIVVYRLPNQKEMN